MNERVAAPAGDGDGIMVRTGLGDQRPENAVGAGQQGGAVEGEQGPRHPNFTEYSLSRLIGACPSSTRAPEAVHRSRLWRVAVTVQTATAGTSTLVLDVEA